MANSREETYYGEAVDKLKWIEVFLGVLLTLVVVGVLAFVLIFGAGDGGGKAPTIFGYTIYLNKATQIEDIPPGVAVIAKEAEVDSLKAGEVAMCRVGDAQAVTLLRVVSVEEAGDGVFYTLKTDSAPDNQTIKVSRQDVVAKTLYKNEFLGGILSFTSTTLGVVILVLVPCLLFIGWQVIRIIRYRREMEEEAGYTDSAEDEEDEDYSGATFRSRGAPVMAPEEEYGEYYEEDSHMDYQDVQDNVPENPARRTVIVPKDRVVVPLTGQAPAPKPQQTYINDGRAEYRRGAPANSNAKELANVMQSASRQRAGIPNRPVRNTIPEEQPKPIRTAPSAPPTSPSASAANAYSRVVKQSQPPRPASVQPQPTPQRRSAAPVPVAAPAPAYKEPVIAQPRRVNPAAAFPPTPLPVQQRVEEPVMSGAVSGVRRPEPARAPELSRPNNPLQSGQGVSTIPPSAARPRQTIAPPPKSSNNKAVDDLMRVIDQAESGIQKK